MKKCLLVVLFIALPALGCKPAPLSPKELDDGRALVETGLQAWKKGDKPDALQKLNPPLRFQDEDWTKGMRLTAWEITDTNGSAGDRTARCTVTLSLVDRKGNKISRRVVYQVNKGATTTIVRDPYF